MTFVVRIKQTVIHSSVKPSSSMRQPAVQLTLCFINLGW